MMEKLRREQISNLPKVTKITRSGVKERSLFRSGVKERRSLLQSNYLRYRDFVHVNDFMISARTFHSFKPLLNHQTVRGPVLGIGDAAVTEQRPLLMGVPIPKNSHCLLI